MRNKNNLILDKDNVLHFKKGNTPMKTLEILLDMLPFEIGFCDQNNRFRWFNDNGHRV